MKKNDYAKTSSENVRKLLFQYKMSVRQLAENIGVPPTTLNDSLKSKKGIPIDVLIKIANYFNLTVNDLCDNSLLEDSTSDMLQKDLRILINKYKILDKHGKELITLIIDKELERVVGKSV